MILNPVEYHLVNSRLRNWHLDREVRRLKDLSDLPAAGRVLEIGCGRGYGAQLIKRFFKPRELVAVDIDPKMIGLARKDGNDPSIRFEIADVRKLPFPNASFDAVFDFGVLHHVPNWHDALVELRRVLKPGGRLLIEDLSIETFESGAGRIFKYLLSHPYQDMYRWKEFTGSLEELGFKVDCERTYHPAFLFKYFVVLARKKRGRAHAA
jgi:ubiquinone/menaquinone biosynthesis C-methylase UbiE